MKEKEPKKYYCKNCHAEVEKTDKICPNCGQKIKKPFYKKWWFWAIIVIAIIAIAGGSGSDDKKESKPEQKTEQVQQETNPFLTSKLWTDIFKPHYSLYDSYNHDQLMEELNSTGLEVDVSQYELAKQKNEEVPGLNMGFSIFVKDTSITGESGEHPYISFEYFDFEKLSYIAYHDTDIEEMHSVSFKGDDTDNNHLTLHTSIVSGDNPHAEDDDVYSIEKAEKFIRENFK